MKPVKFHPEAEFEMNESSKYYEKRQKNLGKRYLEAIQSSIKRIEIMSSIFKYIEPGIQWCRVKNFPYSIVFQERDKYIEIVSIMHARRRPGYWRQRK